MSTPLHEAVLTQDLQKVQLVLAPLKDSELVEAISHAIGNETPIELAFRLGSKDIGFALLKLTSPEHRSNNEIGFSWFLVFDLLEKFLLTQNKGKKMSSKRLADKLSFLKPYISSGDIHLSMLTNRAKFLTTALLLGAYDKSKEALLVQSVLALNRKMKDKAQTITWLIEHHFITQNFLSPKQISEYLTSCVQLIAVLVKHFPACLEHTDEDGKNVLHHVSSKRRIASILACFHFVKQHVSAEKLLELMVHKDKNGDTMAWTTSKKYMGCWVTFPTEFIEAITIIAQTTDLSNFWEACYGRGYIRNVVLCYYLVQIGAKIGTKFQDSYYITHILPKGMTKLHQFLNFVELPKEEEKIEIEISHVDQTAYLSTLPKELILLVVMSLDPVDLFNFFSCNKALAEYFRSSTSNEVLWKNYGDIHFIQANHWASSQRTRVLQRIRGRVNWQKNKYDTIVVEKMRPLLTDDNWIVFKSLGFSTSGAVSEWNCHQQQFSSTIQAAVPPTANFTPEVMLRTYTSGDALPGIIGTCGQYGGYTYHLQRSNAFTTCHGLQNLLNSRLRPWERLQWCAIDHRVVVSERVSIYDPEVDKITHLGDQVFNMHHAIAFNPFNNTILAGDIKDNQRKIIVFDLNSKQLHSFEIESREPTALQVVDEFTVFIDDKHSYPRRNMFVDIRTGKKILEIDNLMNYQEPRVLSPQRMVWAGSQFHLLTSWDLTTRKIEWTQNLPSFLPRLMNSRYLVGAQGLDSIILDFCSNKIKY